MYYILFFPAFSIGLYSLATFILRIPPGQVKRNMRSVSIVKLPLSRRLEMAAIRPLLPRLSRIIPLPERMEAELGAKLKRAEIPYTPREYYARAVILAAYTLAIPLFGLLLRSNLVGITGALLPFLVFRKCSIEHKSILDKRKETFTACMPHFVRSVMGKLAHTGTDKETKIDLISVFEDYIKLADQSLIYDLKLLVTEMKTRSVEMGLRNFAERIGIAEIQHMVSAIIGIYRGQRQQSTLDTLMREIDVAARENRQRGLNRQPGKIKRATIPVVAVTAVMILYVLLFSIFTANVF
jgi:hypothetical protein